MELNRIYNEDCLQTLARLPENSIDLVVTSPPYNKAGYEGFIRTPSKTDAWGRRNIDYDGDAKNDFMLEEDYEEWQIKILNELYRVVKEGGSLFYNHKIRMAQNKSSHPIEWLLKTKWTFRQQIVWDRGSTPNVAPIRFFPTTELILWMTKGAVSPAFNRSKDCVFPTEVWKLKPASASEHPAPFPQAIPANILINFPKGSIVYDPFMGSGTTALAAIDLGMNYIGSEISSNYCEYANRRIQQKLSQLSLF